MFVLPFQHSPQKFLATEIVARFVLGPAQKFLHSGLRSDSRMIHSRQPKDFKPLHPRAACENVLDRVVQNMAEREHARDVRWRHHDRKRWLRRLRVCYEIAILQPALIPLRFNRIRIVPLGKFSHRDQSSESGARLQIADTYRARHSASPLLKGEATQLRQLATAMTFSLHEQPATDRCFRFRNWWTNRGQGAS